MKVTRKDIVRLIKESFDDGEYDHGLIDNPSYIDEYKSMEKAQSIIETMMSRLENRFYGKFSDEEVDEFSIEAMNIIGQVEPLIVKLMTGGYSEDN